jgi:hypothetical protein
VAVQPEPVPHGDPCRPPRAPLPPETILTRPTARPEPGRAPARGRPATARRPRRPDHRAAPAHLPAERAHLRPGPGVLAKDVPDRPAGPLQRICDDLLEASIPRQFKRASTALAADWTDMETFSRPPPHGTSDCADPTPQGGVGDSGAKFAPPSGPLLPELRRELLVSPRHVIPSFPVKILKDPQSGRSGEMGEVFTFGGRASGRPLLPVHETPTA